MSVAVVGFDEFGNLTPNEVIVLGEHRKTVCNVCM
jgi:hypothetical protein